jgi:hypothetical protein
LRWTSKRDWKALVFIFLFFWNRKVEESEGFLAWGSPRGNRIAWERFFSVAKR